MQYKATFELTRNDLQTLIADVEVIDALLASRRTSRRQNGKDAVKVAEKLITRQ